jgi:hypothetical protein
MSCELEDAPTCCEATPKDDLWLPPNHGKQLAAERLDDLNIHVKAECFVRLMAGTPFTVDADGHAVERVDGIKLICILKP